MIWELVPKEIFFGFTPSNIGDDHSFYLGLSRSPLLDGE